MLKEREIGSLVKCWNSKHPITAHSGKTAKGMLFEKELRKCKVKGMVFERFQTKESGQRQL